MFVVEVEGVKTLLGFKQPDNILTLWKSFAYCHSIGKSDKLQQR